MPDLVLFSFSPGATPEEHMALLRGGHQPELQPAGQEEQQPSEVTPKPGAKRKRAKDADGRFLADDPATPSDEAWE